MSNCLFAYPDRTLTATIGTAGTAWNTLLPLSNLQNKLKSKIARSSGVTLAHTNFDITLPTAKSIRMLSIINHNMSPSATITLSFSNIALGGSELGLVSNIAVWPTYFPASTPTGWSSDAYWNLASSPDYWYVLPTAIVAKYIRVAISDTSNAAGYIQLGRCFVADALQPSINLDYGVGMSWQQDADKASSLGGVEWYKIKSQGREISGTLGSMSIDEGMVMVFDSQRILGQEGELYFIFDPSDTVGIYKQRAMLCRHADADPLQYPYFDRTTGSFLLREIR